MPRSPLRRTLTNDSKATSIVFARYTSAASEPGQTKAQTATIAALTGVVAETGVTIRNGIFVGSDTAAPYDTGAGQDITLPLSTTEYSQVNAEFIYRGSTIAPTDQITLPPRTHQAVEATVIENHMIAIKSLNPEKAVWQAHELWTTMLDSRDYLTEEKTTALIANFQFPAIRDQLIL